MENEDNKMARGKIVARNVKVTHLTKEEWEQFIQELVNEHRKDNIHE